MAFGSKPSPSVADIDSFVTLLRVACEDPVINQQLERLLSMPDPARKALVETWVADMIKSKAPKDFIAAIGCLVDDQVAERSYEVIFKCRRGEPL